MIMYPLLHDTSGGASGGGRASGVRRSGGGAAAEAAVAAEAEAEELRQLGSALDAVDLLPLLEREGGWEGGSRDHWATRLSTGEQQRLSFARMLFNRPSIALLDEATGAMDSATEGRSER
jgi:ABC-type uncharacterized transport system fused permease/ATPase subunit